MLRSAGLVALWAAVAVAAVLAGLWAVGGVGSGITSAGPRPLSAAEVDARLSAAPAPAPVSAAGPAPTAAVVLPAAPGGSVVVACPGPQIVSISPAQGWEAKNEQEDSGPRVSFESTTDDDLEVRVDLHCDGPRPVAQVQVETD
ncbi:hypothetical protein [Pseudonocardia sp. WMMC193]|uniref:hypothetical protein n=1 Tax=Pseudonocardia sp. WMMC193 TaxID=2911965 RepID=UPI001F2220AD|nr:hypothetical protein [Pseudonocardia sp. WMMC193]MCF7552881.1 hypothetical protein [Pseudonocardia sp. WMMC193]